MSEWSKTKARRQSELVVVEGRAINPNVPTHGVNANGYVNYLCRCWECTDAWNAVVRYQRAQRMARRTFTADGRGIASGVEHGKATTYTNHRCQCPQCVEAYRIAQREQRARRR